MNLTWNKAFGIVLMVGFVVSPVRSFGESVRAQHVNVVVRIGPGVPPAMVGRAIEEAARIYLRGGVVIDWRDSSAGIEQSCLHLMVLRRDAIRSGAARPALGTTPRWPGRIGDGFRMCFSSRSRCWRPATRQCFAVPRSGHRARTGSLAAAGPGTHKRGSDAPVLGRRRGEGGQSGGAALSALRLYSHARSSCAARPGAAAGLRGQPRRRALTSGLPGRWRVSGAGPTQLNAEELAPRGGAPEQHGLLEPSHPSPLVVERPAAPVEMRRLLHRRSRRHECR